MITSADSVLEVWICSSRFLAFLFLECGWTIWFAKKHWFGSKINFSAHQTRKKHFSSVWAKLWSIQFSSTVCSHVFQIILDCYFPLLSGHFFVIKSNKTLILVNVAVVYLLCSTSKRNHFFFLQLERFHVVFLLSITMILKSSKRLVQLMQKKHF